MDSIYNNEFINTKEKLSEWDLQEIEKKFSFKIPSDIYKHYLLYNGGYPEKCIFVDADGRRYEVEHFIPIKNSNNKRSLDKVLSLHYDDKLLPSWLIPLADEAGGDLYCYSLRENEIGAIYYWSHEFEYGENPEEHIKYLASNIKQFINTMIEDE
ncbi:SMI1/KNR4 family protein [Ruminiclostridium cellulolyticum]|uniref:Knr4/Smi1-like domain-containing protein n=1 Tax=Ruminiclostridium cellulolyticum (strain ATCC 35319 / DSM 5812 / JCM 6584 / H10) TaxID=394503 RepID=B8I222_RUMCH|nr:SMI1/KNR4 family protein [Ruminiclostridium cellulolyticum]ACL75848.1 hypothetical protein Ccel_1495 [Ruminiclostridium cellulolyticum H10]